MNRRRFDLYVTLSSYLDEYSDKNEENPDGSNLYLTVDPDRCGFAVLGPTLELLERVHPRLPATFYSLFSRGLNLWFAFMIITMRRTGSRCCGNGSRERRTKTNTRSPT